MFSERSGTDAAPIEDGSDGNIFEHRTEAVPVGNAFHCPVEKKIAAPLVHGDGDFVGYPKSFGRADSEYYEGREPTSRVSLKSQAANWYLRRRDERTEPAVVMFRREFGLTAMEAVETLQIVSARLQAVRHG